MSNNEDYQPESLQDVEAEDELFGEVIEQSDANIEDVNVMVTSDLSEASKPSAGSQIPLAGTRKSNHAGITDADRPTAPAPEKNPSGVGLVVILVIVAIGGLYLLTMGGDETPAPQPTTPTKVDGNDEPAKPVADKKPAPVVNDEGRGDGTPTLDMGTLTKGMVASGWRVGPPSVDTMDDVTQTNVLVQKEAMAATLTIYETTSWDWTNKLLLETEPPAQALSFGRTVVRVSLGPQDQQNGVVDAVRALSDFKKAARENAENAKPEKAENAKPE